MKLNSLQTDFSCGFSGWEVLEQCLRDIAAFLHPSHCKVLLNEHSSVVYGYRMYMEDWKSEADAKRKLDFVILHKRSFNGMRTE